MGRRHRHRNDDRTLEPFTENSPNDAAWFLERIRSSFTDPQEGEKQVQRHLRQRVFVNGRFTVFASDFVADDDQAMLHLSIKRDDRSVIDDFRELQRIKNAIVGPEIEAVQVFPAESQLVDSSNQYHLWCYLSADYKRPFGYHERYVVDDSGFHGTKQRRFTDDSQTNAEIAQDDSGPDDGSLVRERFADPDYFERFQSGQPMDEDDY